MTGYALNFIAGMVLGWVISAGTISDECKKLGGFYVGSTTYTCEVKK